MPKDREAFVENPAPEVGPRRSSRLSLKISEEGNIDWDSISERQKSQFAELVANDATALEMIGLKAGEGEVGEGDTGYVKPQHVEMFLDLYVKGERLLIPKIIKTKSKGMIVIPPAMAAEAFNFSAEQKAEMCPSGAEWANATIPESWLKWLTENIGPGVKFFGLLTMHTMQQTESVVEMWKKAQGSPPGATVQPPTNGQAQPQQETP